MRARRVSDAQLIKVVVARITRGSAFMLSGEKYKEEQEKVTKEVTMALHFSREEFKKSYGDYLWGYKL